MGDCQGIPVKSNHSNSHTRGNNSYRKHPRYAPPHSRQKVAQNQQYPYLEYSGNTPDQ